MSARANEFLVWRVGTSVGWDCTVTEIASEVGLTHQAVSAIMKRRGWQVHQNGRGYDQYAYANLRATNERPQPLLREIEVEA